MKTKLSIFLFLLLTLGFSVIRAADGGHIAGLVKAVESDKGLSGVMVTISELEQTVTTNLKGEFAFENVPEGSYSLAFMAPGYGRTIRLNVLVYKNQTWYEEVYLQKSADEGERFYIGGIEVTAERELLPDEAATTTRISSGEIEHIQASSLGDVLELIPGQKFSNPGLENVKQIGLRQTSTSDDADRNVALGTQVLMDGVPLSNNANMQLDTDLNDGTAYRVTANSGIDLRSIPADNIESIEVIRGIPSAQYGDLTAGAIIVDTKSGYTPYRAKYKYNPRNTEMNLGGGYQWDNHDINFNLNYAKSLRNIRVEGDSYSRIGVQFNLFSYFLNRKLKWTNRFYYTRTLDEQDVREGDVLATERYNRSFESRYSGKLQYEWSEKKKAFGLFSLNFNRQNSYIKRRVSRDIGVIGTAMEPGVNEGYFVVDYISKLWVKGQAWNIFGQAGFEDQFLWGGMLHKWNSGVTLRHEFNNGPGRQFDTRYPPRNSANEGDRPRPYSDIPGLTQIAFYAEDEWTGHFVRDFSLQLGLRYDMFGFNGFSGSGDSGILSSDFGNFLNPRLNFVYYLGRNTQFRAGYGRTAKAPPISMIYPNPVYYDVVDSMYYDPQNAENRYAIVNTQIFDRTNFDIKAYTRDKYEISIDRKLGITGISLTGFYEEMHDGFDLSGFYPVPLTKYSRPAWPQAQPAVPRDTVLLDYRYAINSVESKSQGIEAALTTKKLPRLNTTLRIDAAWLFSESWWQDNHFEYGSLRKVEGFENEVLPFWEPTSRKTEELIIKYRFDTIVKPLGLWFTVDIQQIAIEKDRLTGLSDSLAVGYITEGGTKHFISAEQRSDPQYSSIRRPYADYMYVTEDRPNLWLINLKVSKELWKGSEVSFFVNNLTNNRPLYRRQRVTQGSLAYTRRNPEIFYGVEFSTVVDEFFNYLKRYQ